LQNQSLKEHLGWEYFVVLGNQRVKDYLEVLGLEPCSDGSGSNFYGLGRASHLRSGFEFEKFALKMSNFSIFCPSGQKKSLRVVSESTRVGGKSASYLLRVKCKLGSGWVRAHLWNPDSQIPSLMQWLFGHSNPTIPQAKKYFEWLILELMNFQIIKIFFVVIKKCLYHEEKYENRFWMMGQNPFALLNLIKVSRPITSRISLLKIVNWWFSLKVFLQQGIGQSCWKTITIRI